MDFIYSKHFKYLISVLVIVVLLTVFHSFGWVEPVESVLVEIPRPLVAVISSTGRGVGSFFGTFSSISNLNKQNAVLANSVTNLQEQISSFQEDRLENQLLKQELDFRATSQLKFLSANVIGKDPSGLSQSIIINVGSHDGVVSGDAVEAQGVFVGVVTEVSNLNSKVLLITDPQSSIDAEVTSNGDKGVLRGSYGSGISIEMISQTSSLTSGDRVVTAGLSGEVPQGLLIGTIGDIQTGKNQLLQGASVVPSVDLKNLIFVSVVLK